MMTNDLLTSEQAAKELGCTEDTVNTMLCEHALPGVKFGRSWRIPRQALLDHLNRLATDHLKRTAPVPKAVTQKPPARRTPPALPSIAIQA